MSAHYSWFAFENSFNPFEAQEESSQLLIRNNQNSISYFGIYSSFGREDESKSVLNIQAIIQNLVGKSEGFFNKEDIVGLQILNEFHNQPLNSDSSLESQSQIQQSSTEMGELGNKKGLKNLAKLLIRTLKKKKYDSSKYLTEEIEEKLLKGKKITKNEHARESKNIRRRTYDALNVMMAAKVLGPDLAFIRRVNSGSFTKKCALIIGQKNQIETKISSLSEKISHKKEFLKELMKKKQALQWWVKQKEIEASKYPTQQQSQNQQTEKKGESKKEQIKSSRIQLPIVVVAEKEVGKSRDITMKNSGVVKLNYQNHKIKIFSDIDCFSILKWNSQIEEEMKEAVKIDDNSNTPDAQSSIKEQKIKNQQNFIQIQ